MSVDYQYPEKEYLLIGKVGKPHGLQGEVKLTCFSGQPENVLKYKRLVLVSPKGTLSPPFEIKKARVQGKSAVVSLAGVTDRNSVDEILGLGVLIAIAELPAAKENEFYWRHFIGKLLVDQAGNQFGRVDSLFNNGAQDILVVIAEEGEILIPVTKEIVIGESADSLIIDPPPGLLEINIESSD